MPRLLTIVVSTRPSRQGPTVAKWFHDVATRHGKFDASLVDLAEVNLPLLDEPNHPRLKNYTQEHTKRWSQIVDAADCFVFVTPEYNFSSPPSLVNALDYLIHEWAYKPAGFVSYGGVSGGLRSVQMTKLMMTSFKIVPILEQVVIPFFGKQIEGGVFTPNELQGQSADLMLDELLRWSEALKVLR